MKSQNDFSLACLNCLKSLNISNFEEFEEVHMINHFKILYEDVKIIFEEFKSINANL